MKTLRKIIPFIFLAASAFTTTGCSMYHSKADKKENFVGFYVLERYQSKHAKTDEETYDRMADEGIVACFTLDINGYGYYGYKSKTTEAWVKPVYSTYVQDDEDPSLYKAIHLTDNLKKVYAWDWKVGDLYEPTMGFVSQERVVKDRPWPLPDKKETVTTLSYTIPWHTYTIYNPDKEQIYQDVSYRKMSDSTDYKQINQLLGTSFVPNKPMEMGGTHGFYTYSYSLKSDVSQDTFEAPYEYVILDTESYSNGKMNLYYSENSNPGKKVAQVSVAITTPGSGYKVTWGEKEFFGSISNSSEYTCVTWLNTDSTAYGEEDPYQGETFAPYFGEGATLEDVIDYCREPKNTPYVVHNIVPGEKKFEVLEQGPQAGEFHIEGLELKANEEFAINIYSGDWRYFEDYVEEETAGGAIVVGSKAGTRWSLEDEGDIDVHYLKATEAGTYDISIDKTNSKVHIVKQ